MRDIKRIEPFLKKVQIIWERNPDLRFQQIISFILLHGETVFNYDHSNSYYWEEHKWEEIINDMIKKGDK